MRELFDNLNRWPTWKILSLGFILMLCVGMIDSLTGDYSVTVFYLLPVFIGTWFVSTWAGFVFSLVSGATIIVAHLLPPMVIFNAAILHVWNTFMEVCFLVIVNFMISQLKKELTIEKALARIDPLTGALNRRSFLELAEYEINQSRRYQRPLTIAYIDLDNFKNVNDMLGHHVGDLVLSSVVCALKECNRNTDLVARIGGDEFIVLYPETNTEAANELLSRTQERLLDTMNGNEWRITFSIGAVTYINPPASVDAMLMEADARMYVVKQGGKNNISHATIETQCTDQKESPGKFTVTQN